MEHVALYLKSENNIPVRASFMLYVVTGRNKKECIFRECKEVCNFQPDNGNCWGNFEDPAFLTGNGHGH